MADIGQYPDPDATETTLLAQSTLLGAVTEAAPASDTASSGQNGRLQRIAQRLTSLIALIPAALGQGTMAQSLRVVLPSDQASIPVAATLQASTNTTEVVGDAAHGASVAGNPVLVGLEARTTEGTAVTDGQVVRGRATVLGKQIVRLDAIPDLSWVYAAAAGGLVTTTGVTAKAAAGAGIRNYVKSAQVINSHATISTEVLIRDGAAGTVLHRGWAQAAGGGYAVTFDPPLRLTANTLVEIGEVTATATAGVLVNLQGYQASE